MAKSAKLRSSLGNVIFSFLGPNKLQMVGQFLDNIGLPVLERSRNSSVGIATGCRLHDPGSSPGSARFSLPHSVQTDSRAHPASHSMGTGGKAAGA
jgi:hypothetical protein